MGISITIPGLSQFIEEIPDGNLILIEGGIDPISAIFVQKLACTAYNEGKSVIYITSRTKEEVHGQICYFQSEKFDFPIVEERSHRHWKDFITDNSLVVLDSFSYLSIGDTLVEVRHTLEEFLKLCKQLNAIVLLTTERGMLDKKVEITTSHLSDGIFQFMSRDTSEGISRFIRIPKWINGMSFDENIHYTFDGKQINVDLRSRVR